MRFTTLLLLLLLLVTQEHLSESTTGVTVVDAFQVQYSLSASSFSRRWKHGSHSNNNIYNRQQRHCYYDLYSTSSSSRSRTSLAKGGVVLQAVAAAALTNEPWFPITTIGSVKIAARDVEERAVLLAAALVQRRLGKTTVTSSSNNNQDDVIGGSTAQDASMSSSPVQSNDESTRQKTKKMKMTRMAIQPLVENRFMDLACTEAGRRRLEMLFLEDEDHQHLLELLDEEDEEEDEDENIIRGAVMVFQSLCVYAMQVGVKGSPEQLKRMVAHLDERRDPSLLHRDLFTRWDYDSVRRLKFRARQSATTAAAQQLLAQLSWRRSTQGAFDLLVALGAWQVHEDVALLRSGFPLSFSRDEEMAAKRESTEPSARPDVDDILGLRRDLTHLKVYTIDSASTSEIDDGLSLEKVQETVADNGSTGTTRIRHRLWVHIADADHWAPRGSPLFEAARKRITSLYLPTNHISMFPSSASTQIMSLRAASRGGGGGDVLALSLGVMLDENGAIDPSSIIITPSKIRVTYRLTYDEVDELLEEGAGCREEWQLGAMLDMATLRRAHRIEMGSTEGLIPNPIPYSSVHVHYDNNKKAQPGAEDEPDISIKVEMSHNAGKNKTTEVCLEEEHDSNGAVLDVAPVSSSNLLVTEAMILACEALPRWKMLMDETDALAASSEEKKRDNDNDTLSLPRRLPNQLRLPFRTQPRPDFKSRARERRVLDSLREYNIGNGLCYAWYIRRFLEPVKISETPLPHSGLGLDYYVQWSSPIRRFSDLQVHASVKRYLRRKRIQELILENEEESIYTLPDGIEPSHLGWPEDVLADKENGGLANVKLTTSDLDQDMDFLEGIGLVGASRTIQRQSQQYWMFEYIRRLKEKKSNMLKSDNKNGNNNVIFRAVVLGCIDPERQQYAIYVPELGLEHRYVSPIRLDPGAKLNLTVDTVFPRTGLLTFVRVV